MQGALLEGFVVTEGLNHCQNTPEVYGVGKKCPDRSLLLSSDPVLTLSSGQTQLEPCLDGKGAQEIHPRGISFPGHTAGQRMDGKEDKWRMGCAGGIHRNLEGCCDSSNWGVVWDSSWWAGGAGRTLRLFTLPLPGLHTVWKVLHIQLRPRWASTTEDHEGWDGQWAGDHARHPAGRVPARMGGDWYVTSLKGPLPMALGLSLHLGTPGLHCGT